VGAEVSTALAEGRRREGKNAVTGQRGVTQKKILDNKRAQALAGETVFEYRRTGARRQEEGKKLRGGGVLGTNH